MGVGVQRHAPAALPPEKTRYPLYRRLGRPQSWSGRVRKISPRPGFDLRTVQPVANRYTSYVIPAPHCRSLARGKIPHTHGTGGCVEPVWTGAKRTFLFPTVVRTPIVQRIETRCTYCAVQPCLKFWWSL